MRAEYNAFKLALSEPPQLAGKVETSMRVTNAGETVRANYAIAYPGVPEFYDNRYTAGQVFESTRTCEFDVRFVAVDADGVMILAEAAMKHLLNRVLSVPGRVCDPIWLMAGVEENNLEFDRTSRLYYMDTSFSFVSRAA